MFHPLDPPQGGCGRCVNLCGVEPQLIKLELTKDLPKLGFGRIEIKSRKICKILLELNLDDDKIPAENFRKSSY